jgi:tetratricopeptide (TPR) repeat protein
MKYKNAFRLLAGLPWHIKFFKTLSKLLGAKTDYKTTVIEFLDSSQVSYPIDCLTIAAVLDHTENPECALEVLEAGLEASPNSSQLLDSLIHAYNKRQDFGKACWLASSYLTDPARASSTSKYFVGNYAYALYRLGRLEQAAEQYENGYEAGKPDVNLLMTLGQIQLKLHRFEQAAATYTSALDLNSENGCAHWNLGAALTCLDKYDEAFPHLERSLEIQTPDDEQAAWLIEVYENTGHRDRADTLRTKRRFLRPTHNQIRKPGPSLPISDRASINSQIGSVRKLRDRLERSRNGIGQILYLTKSIAAIPFVIPHMLRAVHIPMWRLREVTSAYRRGIQNTDQVLRSGQLKTAGDYGWFSQIVSGQNTEAIEAEILRAGLDVLSGNHQLSVSLAEILIKLGMPEDAIEVCQAAAPPTRWDGQFRKHLVMGRAYEVLGQISLAQSAYLESLENGFESLEAWEALAKLSESAGLVDDANEARSALRLLRGESTDDSPAIG